jgi:hypothetical protein
MIRPLIGLLALAALAAGGGSLAVGPESTNFGIPSSVFGGGGGAASSATYAVGGTAGQPVAGPAQSANYALGAGYWPGITDADTDGVFDASDLDDDNDGFSDSAESSIGTNQAYPCGGSGWPAELVGGEFSENKVTIQDLGSFLLPVNHFNTDENDPGFDPRWDLVPGPAVPGGDWISIQDIGALLGGPTSTPPMMDGAAIFNGPTCPLP